MDPHRCPAAAAGGPVRGTPIVLLPRRQVALWHAIPLPGRPARDLAARGQGARGCAATAPCSSTNCSSTRACCRWNWKRLGELVATGMVNADSFAGLRAMLLPASKRASNDKKRRRGAGPTMEEAGRWALVRRASSP
jgi:ATP-dependent Lhr-like helicase